MKIGLLGHGVVGSGVRKIIDAGETEEVRELQVTKILVKDEVELTDPRCTLNADDIVNDPEIDIVVECMGGVEPAHTFAKKALENGKYFVTSNKKMLASCCNDLFNTARDHGVTVHYEAACGGGIPWMASLDRTRRVDDIDSFRGIFNGTTNYILSRMAKEGTEFADMLKEAQALGYAERDPSDDIDGFDVRYKVALSCVKAYDALLNVEDIAVYGIRHIDKKDLDYCRENGMSCKLIGRGINHKDSVSAFVIPVFMPVDDVFASIPLNFNAIESDSKTLGKATFVGQGAGSLPTAHAVVQNVVDIWKDQDSEIYIKTPRPVDNSLYSSVYYVRTSKKDAFADVCDSVVKDGDETVLLTKKISMKEMDDLAKASGDENLFIAEVQA